MLIISLLRGSAGRAGCPGGPGKSGRRDGQQLRIYADQNQKRPRRTAFAKVEACEAAFLILDGANGEPAGTVAAAHSDVSSPEV